MKVVFTRQAACIMLFCLALSCNEKKTLPSKETIVAMNLKRGEVISCTPDGEQFGLVNFEFSGSKKVKDDFNLAIKLLHSFEYDEAEKTFAKIIDAEPDCAMAYWGVAMSNFHPLWTPPSEDELKKGSKAVQIAQSISGKNRKRKRLYQCHFSFL